MKHISIILAFLMTLATQGKAVDLKNGDTFYCGTDDFIEFTHKTDWKLKRRTSQKFKFQIKDGNIIFAGNGYFTGKRVINYIGGEMLDSQDSYTRFSFEKNHFNYVAGYSRDAIVVVGSCDKF